LGVGRALPGDADAVSTRLAVKEVLNTGSYRQDAARFAQEVAGSHEAAGASDEVEQLLSEKTRKAS